MSLMWNRKTHFGGIALVPCPVEVFGRHAELDDEVCREVLRPDLAPLFVPQPDQGLLVLAHDDAGVGAADEGVRLASESAIFNLLWFMIAPLLTFCDQQKLFIDRAFCAINKNY
jgi:hypothetical protein